MSAVFQNFLRKFSPEGAELAATIPDTLTGCGVSHTMKWMNPASKRYLLWGLAVIFLAFWAIFLLFFFGILNFKDLAGRAGPTPSPTPVPRRVQTQEAKEFLLSKVSYNVPDDWRKSECGRYLHFAQGRDVDCPTAAPGEVAFTLHASSPSHMDILKKDEVAGSLNTTFAGKQAVQFEFASGSGGGNYKATVIFYSDDIYFYAELYDLTKQDVYSEVVASLQFN